MNDQLINIIHQANPWINQRDSPLLKGGYIPRIQADKLLLPEWDKLWLVLVGPRQAGKTTLGLAFSLFAPVRLPLIS